MMYFFLAPQAKQWAKSSPPSSFSLRGELSLIAKWKVERVKSFNCMAPLMCCIVDFKHMTFPEKMPSPHFIARQGMILLYHNQLL